MFWSDPPENSRLTFTHVTDVRLYVTQQLSKSAFNATVHLRHVERSEFHLTVQDTWLLTLGCCKMQKFHGGFKKWITFSQLFHVLYELEKKSSLVTHALWAKSYTRDTDVQEMACLYHSCKIWRESPGTQTWFLYQCPVDNQEMHYKSCEIIFRSYTHKPLYQHISEPQPMYSGALTFWAIMQSDTVRRWWTTASITRQSQTNKVYIHWYPGTLVVFNYLFMGDKFIKTARNATLLLTWYFWLIWI